MGRIQRKSLVRAAAGIAESSSLVSSNVQQLPEALRPHLEAYEESTIVLG